MRDRTPLDGLLGRPGEPIACKVLIPRQIEVHWWADPAAAVGTPCLCGSRTKIDDPTEETIHG